LTALTGIYPLHSSRAGTRPTNRIGPKSQQSIQHQISIFFAGQITGNRAAVLKQAVYYLALYRLKIDWYVRDSIAAGALFPCSRRPVRAAISRQRLSRASSVTLRQCNGYCATLSFSQAEFLMRGDSDVTNFRIQRQPFDEALQSPPKMTWQILAQTPETTLDAETKSKVNVAVIQLLSAL